jgi:zinc D-Ala-D-Ala dipeptidase
VRHSTIIPAAIFSFAALCSTSSAQVPGGFVYLSDVAPTVRQDIRYAGAHNFVGRRIDGYAANECILSERAARALARVQGELAARVMSLIVWDCYRPKRAVADFLRWSRMPGDTAMKPEFYPRTDKAALFALGYLSSRSAHARGSAVDLGIVPASLRSVPTFDPSAGLTPCTAPKGVRFDDGTLDFGTGYDCLDPQSSVGHANVSPGAHANRLLLRRMMQRHGFRPNSREWWHFEYGSETVPWQSFDFPVVARDRGQVAQPARPTGIAPAP